MAVNDNAKLNTSWEYVFDKVNTSEGKESYEEAVSIDRRQFGERIPTDFDELAFGESSGVVRRLRVPLTLDNSATGRQSWFLLIDPETRAPTWKSGWSSGGMIPGEINTQLLSEGDHSRFRWKLFGGTNGGTEIFPLDASSPVITPRGGLARFVNGRSELGTTQANSIWAELYDYSGMMLDEVLESLKNSTASIDIGEPVNIYIAARDA